MRIWDRFRSGIKIKRWLLLGIAGIVCICLGLSFPVREIYWNSFRVIPAGLLVLSGCTLILIAVRYAAGAFVAVISNNGFKISLDKDKLSNMLYEKRILIKGPKIVAIGGGTGLSTMLRGLKAYSSNITAIVTVADDGGGSGILRNDLGILPPGDIRNCVLALADTEPIMQKLLQYRFKDGMLKGQSFGNLFLAAMDGISPSFEEAVKNMSDVLAVTGRVLPVTLDDIKLCAELEDGFIIHGESSISRRNDEHLGKIRKLFLEPACAQPLGEALDAIKEADVLVLGPGSLYTSIIANLLVNGVCDAIKKSDAIKVYVCNVMTQPGETDGFTVYDHITALEKHSCKGIIDYCIVNTAQVPAELEKRYKQDGAEFVKADYRNIIKTDVQIIGGDFLRVSNNLVRHDPDKLAASIIALVADEVLSRDKKRIIDYYYVKDRLKKIMG